MLFRKLFSRATASRASLGPPHPISNIRPFLNHDPRPSSSGEQAHEELQLRIEEQRLRSFNHDFWLDTNTRFYEAKEKVLDYCKANNVSSPEDQEAELSKFYSQWCIQESERQAKYTTEWNRRNWLIIRLSLRHKLTHWNKVLTTALLGNPT